MTGGSATGAASKVPNPEAREADNAANSQPEKSVRLVLLTCSDKGTHAAAQLAIARDSRRSAHDGSGQAGRIRVGEFHKPWGMYVRNGAARGIARDSVQHDQEATGKRTFTLDCTRCTRRLTVSESELAGWLEVLYRIQPLRSMKDDFARNLYDWSLDVSQRERWQAAARLL